MKYILSWGGGVNSTAMLAMLKLGMLPELNKDNTYIVFADTGAEMPYTFEHTTRCAELSSEYKWICLRPTDKRWKKFYSKRIQDFGLPEYCKNFKVMPSRVNRWCTMEYKSKPIRKFRESLCSSPDRWDKDVVLLLGIASDETKRAKFLGYEHTMYPLIDNNIDRDGCFKLCEKAKLPLPRKSGCFLCPFQPKNQWIELYEKYPELFKETEEIENIARDKYNGKSYFFIRDLPLKEQIMKWYKMKAKKLKKECEQDYFDFIERHCLCEL